jgi:hypothetical protein
MITTCSSDVGDVLRASMKPSWPLGNVTTVHRWSIHCNVAAASWRFKDCSPGLKSKSFLLELVDTFVYVQHDYRNPNH